MEAIAQTIQEIVQFVQEEDVSEFLESPEAVAVAAPLALIAAAPPPLPTFVPQGTPPPTAGSAPGAGGTGGGGTGGATGGTAASAGGGILPGVALAVSKILGKFIWPIEIEKYNNYLFLRPHY